MIPRLAVLLSGSGSTLQNLIDRVADGRLSASIVGVVSSRADVLGVDRARRAGLPVAICPLSRQAKREGDSSHLPSSRGGRRAAAGGESSSGEGESPLPVAAQPTSPQRGEVFQAPSVPSHSTTVFDAVRAWRPDFVVLAGWIHLLTIPSDFSAKVVNVHPSLLPAFGGKGMYGRHVHEAVLASGARVSGCTVHFADDTYDTGPIIHQTTVPVLDADTPDTLAARVQLAEREAYPEAIARLAAGGWRIVGRRVSWNQAQQPS